MKGLDCFYRLLQCPGCRDGPLKLSMTTVEMRCEGCGEHYPVVHGRPVLLRNDNALFSRADYCRVKPFRPRTKSRKFAKLVPLPSLNLAGERVLTRVRDMIIQQQEAAVLVIGGGCQRQWLSTQLGAGVVIRVIYSDIDFDADVDLYCDGHDLPFKDGAFDVVVTTAVLEHVLYPERVAAEIARVLKVGALLYSELPFMQQVHEGAYDFTRYTLSGHRRLFNHFAEIESGMVAGPATALVWAIENFVLAFVARPILRKLGKALVRVLFAWLKYFDYLLVNRPEAMDGASCTYFLGRKTVGQIPDVEIIARYVGAKHLRHV